MSNTKQVKGVVLPRNDTAKNWSKAINFIPGNGELIVYNKDSIEDINRGYYLDDEGNILDSVVIGENCYSVKPSEVVRFKFGNGADNVNALPFATTGVSPDILETLATKDYVDNKLDTLAIKKYIDNECEKRMNSILAEINDTLQLIVNS